VLHEFASGFPLPSSFYHLPFLACGSALREGGRIPQLRVLPISNKQFLKACDRIVVSPLNCASATTRPDTTRCRRRQRYLSDRARTSSDGKADRARLLSCRFLARQTSPGSPIALSRCTRCSVIIRVNFGRKLPASRLVTREQNLESPIVGNNA
jgi:hypothetical protein